MLKSSSDERQAQPFSIRVIQRSDGQWEAHAKNTDSVPPVIAQHRSTAIAKMDDVLQKAHRERKL